MQKVMKLKKKLQEALKSKQIEIKRVRIKPKTNIKWRTKQNFSRPNTKIKIQEREIKSKRKNLFAIESPLTLENILAHQMR
jgi:cystathionine beta-lyase family protein involved in aluminum resistance